MGDALPGRGRVQAPASVQATQARRVLLISVGVTAALYVIPGGSLIAYPLILLSTFVHEMGHGLAAVVSGGDFVDLEVFSDGSGVARTATDGGRFQRAWISAGGLVGPAVAAAVGFVVGRRARLSRIVLVIGSAGVLLASLLWVRSLIGWLVALGLVLVSLAVALGIRQDHWSQLLVVFLSVQMALSVFSRSEYLFAEGAVTGAGVGLSDSSAIAEALIGPYWFWGAVCGLVSLAALALGGWIYLRGMIGDRTA
ncbi:M50 family metallopeptidase [Euzebya tangerina]|uniref:M50 family metallopeptidase n=1 Tax=Euzebya tangerina TaxID=591198 RepID=UPI000E3122FC|nr:M50 family metallopeptidase [Euzebya tangerina]